MSTTAMHTIQSIGYRRKIGPRAEGARYAGDDHCGDVGIVARSVDGREKLTYHIKRHRIAFFMTVDRDSRTRILNLVADERHRPSSNPLNIMLSTVPSLHRSEQNHRDWLPPVDADVHPGSMAR